jgi:hypothetical protein
LKLILVNFESDFDCTCDLHITSYNIP